MKFIFLLSTAEIITLQNMSKYHPLPQVRGRGNLILLSYAKIPLKDIARISGITRQTASIWIDNWKEKGICGLFDKPGRGRPSKFTESEKIEIIELVKKTPRSLKKALSEIKRIYDIEMTKKTLIRLC